MTNWGVALTFDESNTPLTSTLRRNSHEAVGKIRKRAVDLNPDTARTANQLINPGQSDTLLQLLETHYACIFDGDTLPGP